MMAMMAMIAMVMLAMADCNDGGDGDDCDGDYVRTIPHLLVMFSPFDASNALIRFTDVYDCEQWINTMGPGLGPHPHYLDSTIKLLFCTDGFPAFNYPVRRLSYDIILW